MEISEQSFIKSLEKEGIKFNLETKSIEEKETICLEDELSLDVGLTFIFKEMKVNVGFEYLFSCSLDKKIKANCNYKGILFLNPEQYNNNIRQVYYEIEKDIKETIVEIKKGGLFNSEERYDSKVKTISVSYKNGLKDIKAIKEDYKKQVQEKPNYEFGCAVAKIENSFSSVKRVDFILGIESFLKIVHYGTSIENYQLGLIETK